MSDPPTPRPDWWVRNDRLRDEMGLPPYVPPRFEDDVYTHHVVPDLEERYGCTIRFVGADTRYPEDWAVRIDGEPLFPVGRRRDENGNTVYELTGEEFATRVARGIDGDRG